MNLKRTPYALSAVLAVMVPVGGCAAPPRSVPIAAPTLETAAVERDVRALLCRWVEAFESRNPEDVRGVLSDERRFVWLEDGEVRYPSVESVVSALASFPPELELSYRLEHIRVEPLAAGVSWARMNTHTEIQQHGDVVAQFTGVVSMLIESREEGWRIVAAHTSNTSRSGRPGG